jgi:hypothetical protein
MARIVIPVSPDSRFASFPNGTTLTAPAAYGEAVQMTPNAPGLRSWSTPADNDMSQVFVEALAGAGIEEQETIHLQMAPSAELRSGGEEDDMVLRPAIPAGDANPRVVLYEDDSGGLSWHFAEGSLLTAEQRERLEKRGLLRQTLGAEFRIPARSKAASESLNQGPPRGATRGIITKLGRKILKVFVIPAASWVLEKPTEAIASLIEAKIRKNQLWQMRPDNYRQGPSADPIDWQGLDGKPALLVVHGIFSSVQGMLSELAPSVVERWSEHYEGRIIGFNHLSVTLSPEDNAKFFLQQTKQARPEGKFIFDVLCHSRGGIVSRTLAERGSLLVPEANCEFRRIHFVASPNAGSPLGDPEHVVDMLDVFTNLLTEFPDGDLLYAIEGVLGVVKLLAFTAEISLPGMASMGTHNYIEKTLNTATSKSAARYSAAGSDYFPRSGADNGFLTGPFVTRILGEVFEERGEPVANDLIVPRDSVWADNGHPSFPIANPLLYAREDGVWHSGFFAEQRTIDHIEEFFEIKKKGLILKPLKDRVVVQRIEEPEHPTRGIIIPDTAKEKPQEGEIRIENMGDFEARPFLRGGEGIDFKATMIEAPQKPEVVQRTPLIDFHEVVFEGQPNDLVVRLADIAEAVNLATALAIEFAAGEEEIPITVELSAPGFQILNSRTAYMTVARRRDAAKESVVFTLVAKRPGDEPVVRKIIASFFRGNDCIGAATHFTNVVPADYTGSYSSAGQYSSDPVTLSAKPRENVDLVITVRADEAHADRFEIAMRSTIQGEEYEQRDMGVLKLDGTEFSDFFAKTVDPQFQTFPTDPNLSDSEFEQALSAWGTDFLTNLAYLGRKLWSYLPEAFRNEYLRLMTLPSPPRSLFIFSDEMVLPWELVRPSGTIDGKFVEFPPLGTAHIMGRWKPELGARPQPQAVPIKRMVVLTPKYGVNPLYWAKQESDELRKLVGVLEQPSPVTFHTVDDLLNGTDVQLVHFNGHGDWSSTADLSALRLENGQALPALAFTSRKLGMTSHPFLYLNACTVGRTATTVGRPGGFASTCLDSGWSGIIAPYWRVYDPNAMQFCVDLYRKLACGIAIGEALQQIRRDRPDDFTAQSYAYFGDPNARLLIPPPRSTPAVTP